jgi:hypothetical protein
VTPTYLTTPAATAAVTHDMSTGASTFAVATLEPLPDTVPAATLAKIDVGEADSDAVITVMADTPDGFKLTNPGIRRSDYVYDSDPIYLSTIECDGPVCVVLASVKSQLHEEVIGGSSHAWRLNMKMTTYSNPGHLTWSLSASYWCGVNVEGGNDHTCNNGAAPSNSSMSVNTVVNKPWGATNSITVFPMVHPSVVFSNGAHDSWKFRGWDTLSRASTTKLDTNSGAGG